MRRFFIILSVVLVIATTAIGALVLNHQGVQDRLVRLALNARFAAIAALQFGGDNLDVVFCGTASPMGTGRAQSCIGVLAGDQFFIVDSGSRSSDVATSIGLPVGRLNGVLLTHFHSDHIADLGELHLASWVRGRSEKLVVYGGAGVGDVVAGFNRAYGHDYGYRTGHHGEAIMPSGVAGLVAKTIAPPPIGARVFYEKNGLTISVFGVTHEPIEPAFGYRFDYGGRSVVISGDTAKDDNIARVASGADVLVHEVLQPALVRITAQVASENGQGRLGQLLKDTLTYHTAPIDAVALGAQARVKKIVFTHFAPVPQNGLIARIFRRGLPDVMSADDIILADDGMHLRLPTHSAEIIIE